MILCFRIAPSLDWQPLYITRQFMLFNIVIEYLSQGSYGCFSTLTMPCEMPRSIY